MNSKERPPYMVYDKLQRSFAYNQKIPRLVRCHYILDNYGGLQSYRADPEQQMDRLVQEMHDTSSGLPSKSFKNLISANTSTFAGTDLITWFTNQLHIDEAEAIHLGSMLCLHGYIFPINDNRNLLVKDTGTMYRFQTPYFWPSLNWIPDDVDYAIYLAKRTLRTNKVKHGLDEAEQASLMKLQKILCDKWDFIYQQAQEQVRLLKLRKKADRMIISSQERAFWKLRQSTNSTWNGQEANKKSTTENSSSARKNIDNIKKQIEWLNLCLKLPRTKADKVCESFITRCEMYSETDPLIVQPLPSNPWISDDTTMWDMDTMLVDALTERRVKKWSFGMDEVMRDSAGRHEFERFLASEFSSENIKFWHAVQQLKALPLSQIEQHAQYIYSQFLKSGSEHEINIDSKTMMITVNQLNKPHRLMYEAAQNHIYLLMKKDSYPRFIKSEAYKSLLATAFVPTTKKKFFAFQNKKRSPHASPGKGKRRGSASGEVAIFQPSQPKEGHLSTNSLSQHSYSTGNLKDIDSDISSDMSTYGSSGNVHGDQHTKNRLSPSALKKKLKYLIHTNPPQSVHNLEVPAAPQKTAGFSTQTTSSSSARSPSEKTKGKASPAAPPQISPESKENKVSNVIAPWEDDM